MNRENRAVAVVTGGASGIGRCLAEALARQGVGVVLADIDGPGAEAVAEDIGRRGGHAEPAALDVADAESFTALLESVNERYGRLDYLFNNAGTAAGGEFREIPLSLWRRTVDVNLMGAVQGALAAYRIMTARRTGHIVNLSSLAGLLGYPMGTPYAATKAALVGFTVSLRAEGEAWGVKASVVCPGFVRTGFFASMALVNARNEDVAAKIPMKMMDPERAAGEILEGVRRNRAFIVFPFYARALWWLYRLHPSLIRPLAKKTVADFRAVRVEDGTPGTGTPRRKPEF